MSTSPPSKRTKLEPPPSLTLNDANDAHDDEEIDHTDEQPHCTICLQSFIDRTILPACAHEFCFECILLWSEQSRKCPLCSRSFDSYLIHRIRSQYDYQKHYLPPRRSSPTPLTTESRTNALRNTRRERQWGRRQRQQREEADQLERAIARRRWIYQHHLYAKHIASNPYTRHRPFPTPAQFTASPDLISRMATFLRRELRVWPNLDVEFLTTYTISLMKAIDIRSESAVKLLSEFLDFDTPYTQGARRVNAEHFAHEIYSYLRSPYRNLNTYDRIAQYGTPPEISPPQEIERSSRWSVERSPSRRSRSPLRSPSPYHENSSIQSPAPRHGRGRSAGAHREYRPRRNRSPRSFPPCREEHDPRNQTRRRSPPDGVLGVLRNVHLDREGRSYPAATSSMVIVTESEDKNFPFQSHSCGDEKGKGQVTEDSEECVPATDPPKMSTPRGNDSVATLAVGEAGLIDGPLEGTSDEVADYVDKIREGSSANPSLSRKRSAGSSVHNVHPRNRTLSESVQAYLSRPAAIRHPTRKAASGDERPARVSDGSAASGLATDTRPRLFLGLSDGSLDPDGKLRIFRQTTVERPAKDDGTSRQACSHPRLSSTADPDVVRENVVPSADEACFRSVDRSPRWLGFPPVSGGTPNAHVVLGHVDVLSVEGRSGSADTRGRGRVCVAIDVGRGEEARGRPKASGRVEVHGEPVSLDSRTDMDKWAGVEGAASAIPGAPTDGPGGRMGEAVGEDVSGDTTPGTGSGTGSSGSGSVPASMSTPTSTHTRPDTDGDVDAVALETRLRARARLRVRLAAMKAGIDGDGPVRSAAVSASGLGLGLGLGVAMPGASDGGVDGDMDLASDRDKVDGGEDREVWREKEVVLRHVLRGRAVRGGVDR